MLILFSLIFVGGLFISFLFGAVTGYGMNLNGICKRVGHNSTAMRTGRIICDRCGTVLQRETWGKT